VELPFTPTSNKKAKPLKGSSFGSSAISCKCSVSKYYKKTRHFPPPSLERFGLIESLHLKFIIAVGGYSCQLEILLMIGVTNFTFGRTTGGNIK